MNSSLILGCQQPPFSIAVCPWNEQKEKVNDLCTNLLLARLQVASASALCHVISRVPGGYTIFICFRQNLKRSKPHEERVCLCSRLQTASFLNLQTFPLLEQSCEELFNKSRINQKMRVLQCQVRERNTSEMQRGFRHTAIWEDPAEHSLAWAQADRTSVARVCEVEGSACSVSNT